MANTTATPTLRLVRPLLDRADTTETPVTARIRDLVRLSPEARRHRRDVTRWAVGAGRTLDYDALSLVLAVKADHRTPLRRWTEDDVWRLWWLDLFAWCARREIDAPVSLGGTMTTLFAYLAAAGEFTEDSDAVEDLEAALYGAGGSGPRRLPRSAG